MEKFKINAIFEGVDTFKSKEGKVFNIICVIIDHKLIKVFDFNNTYQAILAENNVNKFDELKLVCEPYIDKLNTLSLKVVNIEV